MKKRIICLTLCIIMSLSLLAGCGGGSTTPPAQSSNGASASSPAPGTPIPDSVTTPAPAEAEFVEKLVFVCSDKPAIIDPGNPASSANPILWTFNMIYNPLVKYTPEFDFIPAVATSWETKDYQHFTFKLRDDVYFHNGENLKADDVAFTIDRAKESLGTHVYDRLNLIESYNIVNDYEIEITLSRVNVDFIASVSWASCGILNRKAVEADPEKGTWIGTGPWKVSEFVSNDYVTLTVNEDYFGEIPVTKTITIKSVAEETARILMLENGEANVVFAPNPASMPKIESNDKLDYVTFALNNTTYLGFNLKDPLMSDINFRMAVAHAINRQDCVNITRNGYAYPVDSGTFWGFRTEFKNTDIPIIPYDLEKAKEYLAKTSYKGEEIEIVGSNPDLIKNAQIFQQNLKEIGINLKIFETDTPTLASYAAWGNTNTQMLSSAGEWQLPASASRNYLYPGTNGNRANYENPEVTALFDKAVATVDIVEREKIYRQIQEMVSKDIPYLGIFNMQFLIGHSKGLDGILLYPNLCIDMSYMYMVKQ